AQGRGRRRRGGRDDRRPSHAHELPPRAVHRLHVAGDRGHWSNGAAGQAKRARIPRRAFSVLGERARTAGETTGFVKLIADAKTDLLLGAHMIGPTVSELAAELVLAFAYDASSEDVATTIHAHPTLSEATKEAALGVEGHSIHI